MLHALGNATSNQVFQHLQFFVNVLSTASGEWASPLPSPTPLITLSLSQQWSVAQPYLKAYPPLIKGQAHKLSFGCHGTLLL